MSFSKKLQVGIVALASASALVVQACSSEGPPLTPGSDNPASDGGIAEGDGGGAERDGALGSDSGAPVVQGTHFSVTAQDWTLPAGPDASGFFSISNTRWATTDLDGDGKLDLVVTQGTSDANRKWRFHKNTGSGFDVTGRDWTLPAGPDVSGFFSISNTRWATTDLDGDGKPDLVVTEGASDANRKWRFYKNTGSGFDVTGRDWTLPAGPDVSGFFSISNTRWATTDLDGDGRPDLVLTEGASGANARWKLFRNTP